MRSPRAVVPQLDEQTVRSLAEVRAGKAAAKIHAAELAEEIAFRVKDIEALKAALIQKLEAQRDFAGQYTTLFPSKVRAEFRSLARTGQCETDDLPAREDWCKSFGFAGRTVRRWTELLDEAARALKQDVIFRKCWDLAELQRAANYSSESNEWYTPAKYIDAVKQVFGETDLDPASSEKANRTVGAKRIFTIEDNGLDLAWFGRVFVNPPYGTFEDERGKKKATAAAFCRKAVDEFASGGVEGCIILVNSLHSQEWQRCLYDFPVCLVDHRIHFVSADGEENENPTFQNIFVYLGHEVSRFAEAFRPIGYVMQRSETMRPSRRARLDHMGQRDRCRGLRHGASSKPQRARSA